MNIIPKRAALKVTTGVMSCIILPQNGVVEGPIHYGSVESSPQIPMGSTIVSHNGNVGSSDPPKRPKSLEVNSANGYSTKTCQEDSDNDHGSLPYTPESPTDSEISISSCPAGDEVLDSDTRELILQFLRDYTELSRPRWNENKALSTMKRVVGDVLDKHRFAYNGMINKLSLDKRGEDVTFVCAVAKNLFADGTTNWGRITSLVAFGAVVCQHLKDTGRKNCVEQVGQEICAYLLSDQREWLVKNNSWEGFVEFFRVSDPESTVRNALLGIAGFAGIGATLALLIR
ncbi:induced myeloid leukemia cell differentiation protein Mcl-1b [Toxotes jaculatrix]|uniref:induced myeloid leukemia cell differentiation protein Mcl-1b n=1 Tax=Toxotes jaculatrix TaxID=941984 RepID=UPI001B3A8BED|nr:induced myeloid leukemia cell differentiation protein Mcl-1b [Toxotes jaculatrix]